MNHKTCVTVVTALVLLAGCNDALIAKEFGEASFANPGGEAARPEILKGLSQLHNSEYEDAA